MVRHHGQRIHVARRRVEHGRRADLPRGRDGLPVFQRDLVSGHRPLRLARRASRRLQRALRDLYLPQLRAPSGSAGALRSRLLRPRDAPPDLHAGRHAARAGEATRHAERAARQARVISLFTCIESGGWEVARPALISSAPSAHSTLTPAAFHTLIRVLISSRTSLSNSSGVLRTAAAPRLAIRSLMSGSSTCLLYTSPSPRD